MVAAVRTLAVGRELGGLGNALREDLAPQEVPAQRYNGFVSRHAADDLRAKRATNLDQRAAGGGPRREERLQSLPIRLGRVGVQRVGRESTERKYAERPGRVQRNERPEVPPDRASERRGGLRLGLAVVSSRDLGGVRFRRSRARLGRDRREPRGDQKARHDAEDRHPHETPARATVPRGQTFDHGIHADAGEGVGTGIVKLRWELAV